MKRLSLVSGLVLVISAPTAVAAMSQIADQPVTSRPSPGAADRAEDGQTEGRSQAYLDEVVCRRVERTTESRLGSRERVCMPRREWDQMESEAQDFVRGTQRAPLRLPPQG